jgi:glucokinase
MSTSRERGRFLGVEIGGTKLQVVLGDGEGRIEQRVRAGVRPEQGAGEVCRVIEGGVRELLAGGDVRAVGVGFGGPIDWRSGRVCVSHHVAGWDGFALAEWLAGVTGSRVAADNDANVAALGEAHARAGRAPPVFYVTMGSGVGAGLCVEGKIYHGATPGECELGHVRLDRSGVTVEQRCSGWAVDARVREEVARRPDSGLARSAEGMEGGEARALAAALRQGDEGARRIIDEVADDLAFGLSHVVHLLHPGTVVLGGGLSLLGEALRGEVAGRLPGYVMEAFRPGPVVELAVLGEDAVPVGALRLAASVEEA